MFKWAALALAVFLPAGGLRAGAQALSRAYLFPVSEVAKVAPPADFVRLRLVASDGVAVHAIELPAPAGARTLVHFHNNRQTVEAVADLARAIRSRGLGVLLVEYRGYGESRGEEPSGGRGSTATPRPRSPCSLPEARVPTRVVLSGTSLGTGIAAEMARRGRGSRLVLVTPYTSIPDLVTDRVPGVPARLLLADRFETLAKAPDIHVPTLVIHGDADEIVPFAMGHRVADAIAGSRFLRVPGGHHGDLFARDGRRLLDAIAALGT